VQLRRRCVAVAASVKKGPPLVGGWLGISLKVPHKLVYKIHVVARAQSFRALLDWSYIKGGLIYQIGIVLLNLGNVIKKHSPHPPFPHLLNSLALF
jgi:hypothetical protein